LAEVTVEQKQQRLQVVQVQVVRQVQVPLIKQAPLELSHRKAVILDYMVLVLQVVTETLQAHKVVVAVAAQLHRAQMVLDQM
jgi:hypothetical protein